MLKLSAKLHSLQKEFLENTSLVNQVISFGGSPANVIIPEIMDDNYSSFMNVIKKHGISAKVFYAHKVNKSLALVRRIEYLGGNIDVASIGELTGALAAGFIGNRILLNGPKNIEFIRLGIQQNCLIAVDNLQELQQIITLTEQHKTDTNVLLRLALKTSQSEFIKDTRFGINDTDLPIAFEIIKKNGSIKIKGFSFHIDTTELSEKVVAFSKLLKVTEKAFEQGFNPEIIDIGGGFKVSYLESEREWNSYTSAIRSGILDPSKQITWNGASYGLKLIEGKIRGSENYYRYYEKITGSDFLDSFLSSSIPEYGNSKIAQLLKDFMLTLFIEPGRSLVYNTGITIAKVNFVKKSLKEEILIGLDMNKSHLSSVEDELFVDPIHIKNSEVQENFTTEKGFYLVGNLCQEHDLVLKHKIFLERIPSAGDILAFPHTGAYHMDFSQTTAIKHPSPKKYVFTHIDGKSMIVLDSNYSPYI